MKKLTILIGFCFVIVVSLVVAGGESFAAGTSSWTATGVTFPIKHKQVTTKTVNKKQVEVITTTTDTYSGGTVTLYTDSNQDPTPASVNGQSCYLTFTGGKEGSNAVTICIENVVIISKDVKTGEKGSIVGTGTITEGSAGTGTGIVFLSATWSQAPAPTATSITLSDVVLRGGTGSAKDTGGALLSATIASITLK